MPPTGVYHMIRTLLPLLLLPAVPGAEPPVAATKAHVLIVVGPSKHPPGTHEVAAGGRLLKHCLENIENRPGVTAELVTEWPKDAAVRDRAAAVVFIGDTFPLNRLPDPKRTLVELDAMTKRGCGVACVHYATGLLGEDVAADGDHPLLRWTGGYFANKSCAHHQSVARVYPAAVVTQGGGDHPVLRGWKAFTVHDEPYIKNYFGPNGNRLTKGVTALAVSALPPEAPQREVIAWGVERPDGGRGFAVTMPHFYKNWANDDLRRFILNGVVWAAKLEVPAGGVTTAAPRLAAFDPAAVEPPPPVKKK
jgi:type 1 glutamine amidotransferase